MTWQPGEAKAPTPVTPRTGDYEFGLPEEAAFTVVPVIRQRTSPVAQKSTPAGGGIRALVCSQHQQ